MKIGIVGLGYVGLPLAVAFAEADCDVVGVDIDQAQGHVAARGSLPRRGHPARAAGRSAGALHVHDPVRRAARDRRDPRLRPDAADSQPRARPRAAARRRAGAGGRDPPRPDRHLGVDDVPGHDPPAHGAAARGVRAARRRGLRARVLARARRSRAGPTTRCATRRRSSAATRRRAWRPPSRCTRHVCDEIVRVSTPEVAELSKLLENIFRSVNIALVNEMAILADRMGIDIWEVVDAAATKPYGFMRFEPGPGMGGHCLPVDPFYLTWKAREYDISTEFIELAGKVNQQMPYFCLERAIRALNDVGKSVKGARILIVGVSYKAGVGDMRESPALKILKLLRGRGADVAYHDPHVPELIDLGLAQRGAAGGRRRRGPGDHRHRPPDRRPPRDRRERAAHARPARRHARARRPRLAALAVLERGVGGALGVVRAVDQPGARRLLVVQPAVGRASRRQRSGGRRAARSAAATTGSRRRSATASGTGACRRRRRAPRRRRRSARRVVEWP